MDSRKMKAIPEPAPKTSSIATPADPNLPIITGKGTTSFRCGACDKTLLVNVDRSMLVNMLFRCPCGTVNELPAEG